MTLPGLDVSVYQGSPDWDAVKASGIQFAFAKATEGCGFRDPTFVRNWTEMLRVGIPVPGAYHFGRPDLGNSPQAEAEWFLNTVLGVNGSVDGCLLALDAESSGGNAAWCDAWCQHLSDLLGGHGGGFYSYSSWIQSRGLSSAPDLGQRNWLWFAWPDSNGAMPTPAPWQVTSMQQFGTASVPGIGGQVDANRFFGDLSTLRALTVGGDDVAAPDVIALLDQQGTAPGQTSFGGTVIDTHARVDDLINLVNDLKAAVAADMTSASTELDGLKAELDRIAAGGSTVDLTPVYARIDALGKHLGIGTA